MIIYRTTGAWGNGSGANLTAGQVDSNFYDLHTRVRYLELNPPIPVQISSFGIAGDQFFVYMSDGSVEGPLTLPTSRWKFRGSWQPGVIYSVDDLFVAPDGAAYLVLWGHTSATTFDPGANDGRGHDYYTLFLRVPSTTLPPGGARGLVLTKNSVANYDMIWSSVPAPPGGDTGQVLTKITDQDGDAIWSYPRINDLWDVVITAPLTDGDYLRWSEHAQQWVNQPRAIFNVIRETSWAPIVGDEGTFMVLTNGTTNTLITIPHDDTQNFQIGSELHIHQDGTGTVTVAGEAGVAILKHASFSNQLLGQYATASVKKTAANEWRLFGLLAGA